MSQVTVQTVGAADRDDWLRMRNELWPGSGDDHAAETLAHTRSPDPDVVVFIARDARGAAVGFLEAGLRAYAEGCRTSPVGYIEGWWVEPGQRRQGVGAQLVAAAENWARARGLSEMASDTELDNASGEQAHRALGYTQTDRIICFRKAL